MIRKLFPLITELIKIIVLVVLLPPGIAVISETFGFGTLAKWAHQNTCSYILPDYKFERALETITAKERIFSEGQEFKVKDFSFWTLKKFDQASWTAGIQKAVSFFEKKFPPPKFVPKVLLLSIEGLEGGYNGLFLIVDPNLDEAFRTFFHELCHVYLFWALVPGLPIDFPRWFNEGMAEETSEILSGSGDRLHDMIPANQMVPFYLISPAFSWPDYSVELQARHAFRFFLKNYGWEGVQKMIFAFRQARSFHSIMRQEFGVTAQEFEDRCIQDFKSSHVLENLSLEKVRENLKTLVLSNSPEETIRLLELTIAIWPGEKDFREMLTRMRVQAVKNSLRRGCPLEAIAWLKTIPNSHPEFRILRNEAIDTAKKGVFDKLGKIEKPKHGGVMNLPILVLLSWFILRIYRGFRSNVISILVGLWYPNSNSSLAYRWFVVALAGCGSPWFISFIGVSCIPYGGVIGIPDLGRILLCNSITTMLIIGTVLQFYKWDKLPGVKLCTNFQSCDRIFFSSCLTRNFLFLSILFWLPGVIAILKSPIPVTRIPFLDWLTVSVAGLVQLLLQSFMVWGLANRWKKVYPRVNPWFSALAFAFVRGGLSANIFGRFALIGLGRLLFDFSTKRSMIKAIKLDLFCFLPLVLVSSTPFPPLEPTCGFFTVGYWHDEWFLIPAIGSWVYWFFLSKRNSDGS
ncbi:MAG: hypothetical protein HQM08_29880 [Candidatus Riflebacteria bacterium]|nr:hypothetical protein [Candidatus Riflebacteria bacterium]